MDTSGKDVEYKSSDIGKKPKEELITNIEKVSKVKKFFVPDNIRVMVAVVVAIFTIGGLVTTIIVVSQRPNDSPGLSAEDKEYNQVRDEVDNLTPGSENVFDVIHDLEAKIATATEAEDATRVYRLKLAMADAYINANLAQFAIDEVINPLIETNRDDAKKLYDLYTRAVAAYQQLGDKAAAKDYLGFIVNLPDNVFPNDTDNSFKRYYENLLREMQ